MKPMFTRVLLCWSFFDARGSRVCGRRVAAAVAAAVVHVEEKEKIRIERIYRSPRRIADSCFGYKPSSALLTR